MKKSIVKKHIFPINLIVDGKKFLIVGGGSVALRKTQLLLDASAEVTVVSPELCRELVALKEQGGISVVERAFLDTDVAGMFLVFAATNTIEVNRSVIATCNACGVLVCSVDEAWPHGDFITPAIVRKNDLVLTVSTGGSSCTRARMVKENIARNIESLDTSSSTSEGVPRNAGELFRQGDI